MQVGLVNVKGGRRLSIRSAGLKPALPAGELVYGRAAQGGVERHVVGAALERQRLDVTPALALGARCAALAGDVARDLIQRRVQLARPKCLAQAGFLPPVPFRRALWGIRDSLRQRVGGAFRAR